MNESIDEIRRSLASDGFHLVVGAAKPNLVEQLRDAVADVLCVAPHRDLLLDPNGVVRKITYPLALDARFVTAVADPALLTLALSISPCPEELALTWEDVLHKAPLVGEAVPVHQDLALQSLPGPVYSLGVHLDDASDNPIWFLPGSHRLGPQTKEEVRLLHRSERFVPVSPKVGDVVIHDVLCIHYSEANRSPRPRTTWYLEHRTLSQLRADDRWPDEWALDRRAILFHACAARRDLGMPFVWPPLGPNETIEGWLAREPRFRVPHISYGVDYDVHSPWFHFG